MIASAFEDIFLAYFYSLVNNTSQLEKLQNNHIETKPCNLYSFLMSAWVIHVLKAASAKSPGFNFIKITLSFILPDNTLLSQEKSMPWTPDGWTCISECKILKNSRNAHCPEPPQENLLEL